MDCVNCKAPIGATRVGPGPKEYELLNAAIHCDECTSFFCATCADDHETLGCAAYWDAREAVA